MRKEVILLLGTEVCVVLGVVIRKIGNRIGHKAVEGEPGLAVWLLVHFEGRKEGTTSTQTKEWLIDYHPEW